MNIINQTDTQHLLLISDTLDTHVVKLSEIYLHCWPIPTIHPLHIQKSSSETYQFLHKFPSNQKNLILGDGNFNHHNTTDPSVKRVHHLLAQFQIQILVLAPTRVTAESATSIVCCYTDLFPDTVITKIHTNLVSDHLGVSCRLTNFTYIQAETLTEKTRIITTAKLNDLKKPD